jgi:hypothetical protein
VRTPQRNQQARNETEGDGERSEMESRKIQDMFSDIRGKFRICSATCVGIFRSAHTLKSFRARIAKRACENPHSFGSGDQKNFELELRGNGRARAGGEGVGE